MRALLLATAATAALLAAPVAAQDHSAHGGQSPPAPQQEARPTPAEEDHSGHGAMDHAQMDHSQMDHSQHTMLPPAPTPTPAPAATDHSQHGAAPANDLPAAPPTRAFEGPTYAADAIWGAGAMAPSREASRAMHGGMSTGTLLVERLEASLGEGHDGYAWDVTGWYGTATDKIVFKTEGAGEFGGAVEEAEAQILWGHAIGPWVDLQAGMRVDAEPGTRAHAVIGLAGLAPYNVHFDLAAFVSSEGDITARFKAEHDMRLTQRLILQPRVEADFAAQDIPELGVDAGFNEIALGARLRYEIVREFAPYVGVEYTAGDAPDRLALLLGLRTWF